jgi:hypothetical protein
VVEDGHDELSVGLVMGRWIARLLLVRSLWEFLGRGGRRLLCGCLGLLVLLSVVALGVLGWFVCAIIDRC